MVKKFFGILTGETGGLHNAAYLLAFFTILSTVLALFRDRLFANNFGAGTVLDLYYASFRIPDLIFVSIASFVSISVLVPFLTDKMKGSEDDLKKFINTIFSFFLFLILGVSVVAYLFVPKLISFMFPGYTSGPEYELLVTSTRIMLLSPILLGISNFLASITQTFKRFMIYAISPLFYNLGIIFGIVFFYPVFGFLGLAYGVVLGAFAHLVIQVPFVVQKGLFPKVSFNLDFRSVRRVVILSISRTLALSTSNIATIFLLAFGSLMAAGSIAVFNLSWNMQSVPLAIVGVSYSTALFPTISKYFSQGDRSGFIGEMIIAARHIVFWSIPITVLFIVLRAQIVRTILGAGEFTWSNTRLTAAALAIFSVSVLAQSLSLLFIRAYYASGRTKIPLIVNMISGVLIVASGYIFWKLILLWPFFRYFVENLFRVDGLGGTEILALPLGYSFALMVNLVIFWVLMKREFAEFSYPVAEAVYKTFSASVLMGLAAYLSLNIFNHVFDLSTGIGIFMQGFMSGIIGILVAVLTLIAMRSRELAEVWDTLHKKIWKEKVIVPEQGSIEG